MHVLWATNTDFGVFESDAGLDWDLCQAAAASNATTGVRGVDAWPKRASQGDFMGESTKLNSRAKTMYKHGRLKTSKLGETGILFGNQSK